MANRAVALSSVKIALNGVTGPKWYHTHTADTIFCGYLVQKQDYESVIVMDTTVDSAILGVAGLPSYKDNTLAYAANERTPVWIGGCKAEVWVTSDGHASEAWAQGAFISGSDQTAGLCELDGGLDVYTIGRVARGFTDVSGTKKNFRMLKNV